MPNYPGWLQIEPLGDAWPGERTKYQQSDQFRSTIGQTSTKLADELDKIDATNVRLRIAVERFQITVDGRRLKAGQEPVHSGVVLVFDTKAGEQVYPSDGYFRWQGNLHAIALTLEALRALDRWMVTHGQQYRGFLAIESSIALAGQAAPFTDAQGAVHWLQELLGASYTDAVPTPKLLRDAQRATHPDLGGDADQFRLVSVAERLLREAGQL